MHVRRTLTALLGVGALAMGVLTGGPTSVAQASPSSRTWFVAQSGTASFGSGTSCAAPDVVGTDDTAIRTALAAVTDDDTVAICDGVYTITRTLSIDDSIAIQGQSAQGTVLDGGDEVQIMRLEDSAFDDTTLAEVSVVVQDLTFRNGNTGANGVDACNTRSQCGGAIFAEDESNLTVRRSYFLHNTASFIGGAIANHGEGNYVGGEIRIYDSTFEANTGDIDGGGIGVAFNYINGLTVVNSTFVDNQAWNRGGGGIAQAFADATVISSTFVNNRAPGGTALGGPFTVSGSLLAAEPGLPGDLCNFAGTFSNSVATSADCGASTVVSYASLTLRELGWWGGPTPTVWLGPGSSAVNANAGACQSLDQRGANRSAAPCDAGAYERQSPTDESVSGTLNYPAQVVATNSAAPLSSPSFGGGGRSTGYTSLSDTICTVDETTGLVTGVQSGTCSAQWYLKPTLTQDGAVDDDTLSVVKAEQAPLAIVPPGPLAYGPLYPMSTTGGSGVGGILVSEGASTGCAAYLFVVYVTDVSGTCVLTATKSADGAYNAVTSPPITVELVKGDQYPLTIVAPQYLAVGSAVALSTSGGDTGGPVTYSAGPSDVCTVDGSVLRMLTSLGQCRVDAVMAGDTNFNPVPAAPVTVEATSPAQPDATLVPGAPTDVTASWVGTRLRVAWTSPSYVGAFPISHYYVESSPKGATCMVPAARLTCDVSGLSAGTAYTFTVRALNGIGWSVASTASKAMTPGQSVVIAGSRRHRIAVVTGTTTGFGANGVVTPWIRLGSDFEPGKVTVLVSADGTFRWERRMPRRGPLSVYFEGGGVRSNVVVVR